MFAWICVKSPWFRVIKVGGFVTSKFQLILLKFHYCTKKHLAYLCWQDFVQLVTKTIMCSNVMTQMTLYPEMKYKYVGSGSLPQFYFTTKCYLEIKSWKCGIKMRNQSTILTNIASSGWTAAIASILNHITTIDHLYELLGESLASTVNLNFLPRAIRNALIFWDHNFTCHIQHALLSLIRNRKSTKKGWVWFVYPLQPHTTTLSE